MNIDEIKEEEKNLADITKTKQWQIDCERDNLLIDDICEEMENIAKKYNVKTEKLDYADIAETMELLLDDEVKDFVAFMVNGAWNGKENDEEYTLGLAIRWNKLEDKRKRITQNEPNWCNV